MGGGNSIKMGGENMAADYAVQYKKQVYRN